MSFSSIANGLIGGAAGGVAVAGAWIYEFLTNRIISKEVHDKAIEDRDKQIAEWKEVAKLAEQRAELQTRRAESATEAANTANLLLAGIRKGI